LLILIAAVPRVILQLNAPLFYFPDSTGYLEPAVDLLNGQGLTNRLKRPIGYPLVAASAFAILGFKAQSLTALQHVIGVGTVWLTYLLGRACANRWVGFGAGLMVALNAPLLTYEQTPLTESLFAPLLAAVALLLVRALSAPTRGLALATGGLLGVATLVRPVGQAVLPLALLPFLLPPGRCRARWVRAGLVLAAFVLVLLPWSLRNLAVHGRLSSGGALGESLIARTLQYSRGQFVYDGPDIPPSPDPRLQATRQALQAATQTDATSGQVRERLRQQLGLSEAESDDLLRQAAMQAIARDPWKLVAVTLSSIAPLFLNEERSMPLLWLSNRAWVEHPTLSVLVQQSGVVPEQGRQLVERVLNIYRPERFGLIPPALGVLGLLAALAGRRRSPLIVPAILTAWLVLLQLALDGPVMRYRNVLEPLITVSAVGGLLELVRAFCSAGIWLEARAAGRTVWLARAALALPFLVILGAAAFPRFWQLQLFDPSMFGNEYDEGIRLEQLFLMSRGYRPFYEIYASQGPLLLAYMHPWFQHLGQDIVAARLPVVFASLVAVVSVYLIGREIDGRGAGLIAMLLLGLSPAFLEVSRLALAEVPSMAPCLVGVWLAIRHVQQRRATWMMGLSGLSCGLGILMKPMAVLLLGPIALSVLAQAAGTENKGKPVWRRALAAARASGDWLLFAVATVGITLALIGPTVLYEQFVAYRQGAVGLGALGRAQWTLLGNWEQIRRILVIDSPLLVVASASALTAVLFRPLAGWLLSVWFATTLAGLLLYSPLSEKHVSYLLPSIALLAGVGVAAAVERWRSAPVRQMSWSAGLVALVAAWYVLQLNATSARLVQIALPNASTMAPLADLPDAVDLLSRLSGGDEIVTDHPYLAFLARQRVPPRLADVSRTRILSGALTDAEMRAQTTAFTPKAIVYWAGRMGLLRDYSIWIQERYSLYRMYDHARALYVRRDLLGQLPEYQQRASSGQGAMLGGVMELMNAEYVSQGTGRDVLLSLTMRALRDEPLDNYVLRLELRSNNNRTVFTRDDKLTPAWYSGGLTSGQPLVVRRWFDFDGVADGTYTLVVYVATRGASEPLPAAPSPDGRFPLGPGRDTIALQTVQLK
jgi:4-amino-4-deoxy-L-arabinose transferase-like glycosyltransferase